MRVQPDLSILDLEAVVAGLPAEDRLLFHRIFHVATSTGEIRPPSSMRPWIERQFGGVEATLRQTIVKVTNLVTMEGVLYNWLRSSRPMWSQEVDLEAELARDTGDPLDRPEEATPEDVFGRVRGRFCVTASNVAKFDGFHGLVVFDERNPLRWDRDQIADYIDTGARWAEAAHRTDPAARYYLFIWNCLWRAGASLLHGHAQVMLGRHMHYAKVEALRRAALYYAAQHRASYFEDLYRAHELVGCGFQRDGVKVMANLAPLKEHEVLLLAPAMSDALKDRIFQALSCYRDRLGVTSFNLVIYQPPLGEPDGLWEGFPVLVRLVDRGNPTSRTADIGAMELYAASVVSSDPFRLAQALREQMSA